MSKEDKNKSKEELLAEVAELRQQLAQTIHLEEMVSARRAALEREIAERARVESELQLNEARFEALFELSRMTAATEEDIISFALEEAVRLTGSKVGYLYFVKDEQVRLEQFIWSKQVARECDVKLTGHYPLAEAGIWADCARLKRPVVHNDYQNLPHKQGYPASHVHLTRHMNVAIFQEAQVIAVAGVGNKDAPYNDSDVRQLSLFMNSMWEIVQRKRAERALRASESRYRGLFEDAPIAMWEEDFSAVKGFIDERRSAGVQDFRAYFSAHPEEAARCVALVKVIDINKSTVEFFHAQDKAELLESLAKVFVADSYEVFQEELIALAAGRTMFESEIPTRTLSDALKRVIVRVVIAPGCEQTWDRVFVSFLDITARKEAEEALARSNADLQDFAYIISHDLQEPLRMVTSFLDLLEQEYRADLAAEALEFIHFAIDGASRMKAMIDGILTYSRVQTHGDYFTAVDSAAILQEVIELLQFAIEESAAVITYDSLPIITADAVQLAQLFQNLISNALKFRGAGQPHIHIAAERVGQEWVFSVRDNGIGIDPEERERIFIMFQRLHTREEYAGIGVGLAICKRIVERYGGRIWVESQPGAGATFYFTVPV